MGLLPSGVVGTGAEVAAACGVSPGTLINSNTQWMGFAHKGKILYVPQKPIRHSVSWSQFNALELITGKRVKLNGVEYIARAFDEDANEWVDLMRRVSANDSGTWAKYSDAVLVLSNNAPGQNTMTQKQNTPTTYLGRGSQGINFTENLAIGTASMYRGWRPVMELIG